MVRSEAVRSPDVLEQNPDYSLKGTDLTDNYLSVKNGTYFMHQWPSSRHLDHEKIVSHELGYYAQFANPDIELDIKVYHEHMTQLISEPISLNALDIESNTQMSIEGAELQLNWRIGPRNWIWLAGAYVNADMVPGEDISGLSSEEVNNIKHRELRLSAQDSVVLSWHHKAGIFSGTASHLWYDTYNPLSEKNNRYRRYEINLKVEPRMGRYTPWFGINWHHLVDGNTLLYKNQRYADEDIFFFQAGLNF
jgi:iron complex outermembrane receptor protein